MVTLHLVSFCVVLLHFHSENIFVTLTGLAYSAELDGAYEANEDATCGIPVFRGPQINSLYQLPQERIANKETGRIASSNSVRQMLEYLRWEGYLCRWSSTTEDFQGVSILKKRNFLTPSLISTLATL